MSTIPRIQHNIASMNAYRNYSANSKRLTGNLEKLSSGYRINRAGDDAAGLAISEKMRAQISGLTQAKKNATDGISLIQTAEGALTEVHDMLNRMVTLTEQSANGTYDNEVDRNQLQKEVTALKSEINRIADSTNYNGIKLLDGSLDVSGVDANLSTNLDVSKTEATSNTYKTASAWKLATTPDKPTAGDKLSYTVSWRTEDGTDLSKTVNMTVKDGADLGDDYTNGSLYFVSDDGTVYSPTTAFNGSTATTAQNLKDLGKAMVAELNKDEQFAASFEAKDVGTTGASATVQLQFTAKETGSAGATITATQITQGNPANATGGPANPAALFDSPNAAMTQTINGQEQLQELDLGRVQVLKGAATSPSGYAEAALKKAQFEVDGKKFVMVSSQATATGLENLRKAIGDDVHIIQLTAANAGATTNGDDAAANAASCFPAGDATNAANVAADIARVTGMDFFTPTAQIATQGGTADGNGVQSGITANHIYYRGKEELSNVSSYKDGKLTLQIGDTSDDFNKLSINVKDMHIASMGLDDVDISTQEGAAAAMDKIKAAVNYVSDVRGGLGALQNRLDHTINNLGVMTENIQSAEGAIRDTDVAEEMMAYTKNNILNQAAQAMLAQANQLPQGVLQLIG